LKCGGALAALRRSFTGAPGRSWVVEQINDAVGRLARTLSPYPDPDNWDEETLRSERYFYDGIRRIQEVVVDGLPTLAFAQSEPGLAALAASCLGACQHDVDGDALPAALEAQLLIDDDPSPEPPVNPQLLVRLSREYIWGPGDRGVDELLAQFDEFDAATFVLLDEGGDAIALCDLGGSGGAARVVAQYTYDPYGQVITHEHLHAHAWLHAGHKGLFVDRLDLGVANSAGDDQPRLASGANLLAYNRNRTLKPDLGRYLQQDPNATGMVLLAALARHGSAMNALIGAFGLDSLYDDGPNLYQYLRGTSWSSSDPLGLFVWASDTLVIGFELGRVAFGLIDQYAGNLEAIAAWVEDWSIRDDLLSPWAMQDTFDPLSEGPGAGATSVVAGGRLKAINTAIKAARMAGGIARTGAIYPTYYAARYAAQQVGRLLHAHHIVEVRVLKALGLPTNDKAVLLTPLQHGVVTAKLRQYLPYGTNLVTLGKEGIIAAYRQAYAKFPTLLDEAIEILNKAP
jgi:hypothetical protein